jgi:hypothetical protein
MRWLIREPREPLIATPDIPIGDFEESRSSPSKSSHDSETHHFLWGWQSLPIILWGKHERSE